MPKFQLAHLANSNTLIFLFKVFMLPWRFGATVGAILVFFLLEELGEDHLVLLILRF